MRLRTLVGGVVIAVLSSGVLFALPYPGLCDRCLAYYPAWMCVGICGF